MGSGARELASSDRAHGEAPQTYHVLMSQCIGTTSWVFPSSSRLHPRNRIRIYGCHAVLEQAFRNQNGAPSFPGRFLEATATIEFVTLVPIRREICGFTVTR